MTRSRFVKISFIISILIQIGFESFGQIGNEWFNPSQSYFKFKIGQKGIYRLNYNTLSNHGIQINALRKNLDNWQIIDLNQLSHYDIAKTLNESSIFLSSNLDVGFALPAIESIASGCLAIGYPGKGGKEYFKKEFSVPIPEKDIQQFALKLEESIQKKEKQPQFLNEIAKKARAHIESHHNEAIEKQDIKNVWDYIIKANSIKINA